MGMLDVQCIDLSSVELRNGCVQDRVRDGGRAYTSRKKDEQNQELSSSGMLYDSHCTIVVSDIIRCRSLQTVGSQRGTGTAEICSGSIPGKNRKNRRQSPRQATG